MLDYDYNVIIDFLLSNLLITVGFLLLLVSAMMRRQISEAISDVYSNVSHLATKALMLTHSEATDYLQLTYTRATSDSVSIREYVRQHQQVSSSELATLYSVSLRTAQRAIKNINQN
jgi:hypothetical protein